MFEKNSTAYRHVSSADVRLTLAGQQPVNGVVYLFLGQRLSDLLNDPRSFLPLKLENGETVFIAKNQILSVTEIQTVAKEGHADKGALTAKTSVRKGFDPYAILRIPRDANLNQVRSAYKTRIRAVHPDTIAALGLDEDLSRAALLAAQKVNYAYKTIMRERNGGEMLDAAE